MHQDPGTAASAGGDPQVLWLYGVTARDQPLPEACPVPLVAIPHRSLSAIVERVPRAEFAPEVLEARMLSVPWITTTARRHQMVLDAIMSQGLVIPARLCTLFSSEGAVEDAVAASEARFAAMLPRLSGCREWGLKLYCDQQRLVAAATPTVPPDGADVSPGRAYILAKQRHARAVERADERVDEVVEEVLDELSAHAVEIFEKVTANAPRDELRGTLAANVAVLLARGGEEEFHDAVRALGERLAPDGFCFEQSGPWAPYGFCQVDEERNEQ